MKHRLHSRSQPARTQAWPLALLVFASALSFAPRTGVAQTDPPPDKAPPQETDRPPARDKTPLPKNPLVLLDPQDGSGNNAKQFDNKGQRKPDAQNRRPDYGNFRDRQADPREPHVKKKELPFFGYSFFAPARQFILARRAYYAQPYRQNAGFPTTRSDNRSGIFDTEENSTRGFNGLPSKSGSGRNLPRTNSQNNRLRKSANGMVDTASPDDEETQEQRRLKRSTNKEYETDDLGNPDRRRPIDRSSEEMMDDEYDEYDEGATQQGGSGNAPNRRKPTTKRSPGDIPDETDETQSPGRSRSTTGREKDTQDEMDLTSTPRRARRTGTDTGQDAYDDGNDRSVTNRNGTRISSRNRPNNDTLSRGLRSRIDTSPLDAFSDVADPLSQLFHNVTASLPTNYQLSAGDKLTVRYQTPTLPAREFTGIVDSQGRIDVDGLGYVVVRGQTLELAQNALRSRLRSLYKNVDVSLNLAEVRTIAVTITGESFDPGTYTLPATATAYNLVQISGGPTEEGSLRQIEVSRQGRLVGTLDFYQLMRGASGKQGATGDIPLQSGDVVTIPPRQSNVSITGEVRTPAIFELIEGETLKDALRYAGGIKATGLNQSVQLNTIDPGRSRVLKSLDIKNPAAAEKYPIYDGDTVDVFSVRSILANKVTVEGAIEQPGDYALLEGMRVADLIELARGPLSEAALSQAELYRWNPDNTTTLLPLNLEKALAKDPSANVLLTRWDRLKLYTRQEVAWTGLRKVEVRGAVQYPGTYERSGNMHITDLLRQVGGPTPDAQLDRAVLLHQRGDGTFAYETVNVAEALKGNSAQNVIIEDNDLLSLYKVSEAQFTPEHVVSIRGAVVSPGIYRRGEGMKLSDLLNLAGGFQPAAGSAVIVAHARKVIDSPNALPKVVSVTFDSQRRCAPKDDMHLEDGDVVTIQGTGGFIDHVQIINVQGAVNKPGPIILASKNMRLSDAIKEAGGLRPEAFPEGAAFLRDPKMLASTGQRDLTKVISELNNLLNDSTFKRELAKSDIARIQAAGQASADSSPIPLGLGGASAPANPAAAVLAGELSKRELVTRPRALKEKELEPNGAIAVNLPEALHVPSGAEDILLIDGDIIVVPEKPTTVQVVGAVVNPRGVLYRQGAKLDYYVDQAGGYAPDFAKANIVIIRANGGTIPSNRVKDLRPGDVILVPTRVLAEQIKAKSNPLDTLFKTGISSFFLFRLLGL